MEFWLDIAAFALKAVLIVGSLAALVGLVARLTRTGEAAPDALKITSLNEHYDRRERQLTARMIDVKAVKKLRKTAKKATLARRVDASRRRVYVLDFKGDIRASGTRMLADEIDALLTSARPQSDEIVVRVESPGGTVTGYGLAAAQLLRLKQAGLRLTVCVDQVAASGGYLMACTADRILAAPFAVVGSIGVVAQVPNLHRLLKKNDIDYEEITAGQFKRSVSLLGEITPEGREHFRGKLDTTHIAFKQFVGRHRPNLALDAVGNGDYWYGEEALGLGLVDELITSDEYLFRARTDASIYKLSLEQRKSLLNQLLEGLGFALHAAATRLFGRDITGGA